MVNRWKISFVTSKSVLPYQHFQMFGSGPTTEARRSTLVYSSALLPVVSCRPVSGTAKICFNGCFTKTRTCDPDYAPDAPPLGYLYSAPRRREACPILRTVDPFGRFEEVSRPFAFLDPDLFCDADGPRVFLLGLLQPGPDLLCGDGPRHDVAPHRKSRAADRHPSVHGFERAR